MIGYVCDCSSAPGSCTRGEPCGHALVLIIHIEMHTVNAFLRMHHPVWFFKGGQLLWMKKYIRPMLDRLIEEYGLNHLKK